MELFLLPLLAVVLLAMPLIPVVRGQKTGIKAKRAFIYNLCGFFGIMAISIIIPLGGFVNAESASAATSAISNSSGLGFIAAALATGMSSLGAGIAVAAAAPAAIGAVSEEPKSFVKALIFVALGEGVAIYGLLISILILNKI